MTGPTALKAPRDGMMLRRVVLVRGQTRPAWRPSPSAPALGVRTNNVTD
jgi:hypothetical protein